METVVCRSIIKPNVFEIVYKVHVCVSGQIHGAAASAGAAPGERVPAQSRWQDSWAGPRESEKGG